MGLHGRFLIKFIQPLDVEDGAFLESADDVLDPTQDLHELRAPKVGVKVRVSAFLFELVVYDSAVLVVDLQQMLRVLVVVGGRLYPLSDFSHPAQDLVVNRTV